MLYMCLVCMFAWLPLLTLWIHIPGAPILLSFSLLEHDDPATIIWFIPSPALTPARALGL